MSEKDDFVHLHVHSDMSQLDGCGKIPEYVRTAAMRGNKAVAMTDHGTMRGYMQLHYEAKDLDIKPIYGIEFYVSPDMHRKGLTDDERAEVTKGLKKGQNKEAIRAYEDKMGIRDRWHLTAWALNQEGLKNLYRLSSSAFIDGFYYKPRIDVDTLIKYGDGIAVGSGCLSSPINDSWMQGKRKMAMDYADRLSDAFGDRFYLEIMPHNIRDQVICNKMLVDLKARYGSRHSMLVTQDAHYVDQSDAPHHEVLLCIGTNSNLSDPERFKFDDDEFFMKTRVQMAETFRRHHPEIPTRFVKEGLDATVELSERCSAKVEIDYHKALLPDPGIPEKYKGDHYAYFKDLAMDGWAWREIPRRAKACAAREGVSKEVMVKRYIDRLKHELGAIKRQGFVLYFLMVRDIYSFARSQNIMVGPGRGSVGGSLVAYLLGITSVDPIEHGLIFERFINPARMDEPDIDMDFEDRRRIDILNYVRGKYGSDKVCQIATVGKLSGKQCIRDVSRVLGVPLREVDKITKSIIERSSGDERASSTIEDSFNEFEVCRDFNKKYPQVLHHARRLEGMAKNLGIHAAGIVASPVPLTELMPLEIRKHDGRDVVVSAVDMYGVGGVGLVKLDVLGLRTLTVIKEALEMIERRHGRKIDMENPSDVDLNDPLVLKGFTDHNYGGVFQYDTPSADKVCSGVEFTHFEDIAAMTALNRPGTSRSGLATEYVRRKKDPSKAKKDHFHPSVTKITSDTLGIIVYQEHVIKIFTECAGFPPGTADSLRKTIAKKVGDETMGKERENFIRGCKEHSGIDEKTAGKIMDAITFFGCLSEGTEILSGGGAKPIEALRPGDSIVSADESGRLVGNRVKACGPSGRKEVFGVCTNHAVVEASAGHFWLTRSQDGTHAYKKTSELEAGDLIGYATGLNHTTGPKLQDDDQELSVRTEGEMQGFLQRLLPSGVQAEANGGREPGWVCKQQDLRSGEGLEKGSDQTDFQGRRGTGRSNLRAEQPGLDGRSDLGVPEGQGENSGPSQRVPEVRSASRQGPSRSEYEGASRTPQGPGHAQQLARESGSDLPVLPLKGALGGQVQGRLSWSPVLSVESLGTRTTHDIECEAEPANYVLANGLVSHNSYGFNKSHATEYGMIAHWCMWLKTYYPLEFYWSLMANEPDRLKIQQIAKDAKKFGIKLLPPHVNISDWRFSVDGEKSAIRGSLVDIKGCGVAASRSIIETQPYKNLIDFVLRVNRRAVHRGVVLTLAKSGALDGLLPNNKHFIENVDAWWKELTRQKLNKGAVKALIHQAKSTPDFSEEDKALLASKVSPLAFGAHPIDAYSKFMEREVKFPTVDMGGDNEESFFKDYDNKGIFVAGVIVEVKYNQIGDFHTGAEPSADSKRKMFWGARYANVNIEDRNGKQNRFKVDIDIFDQFRGIVDKGVGTPVIAHCHPMDFTGTLRTHGLVNIEEWRERVEVGGDLEPWERIVSGRHPAVDYPWGCEVKRVERTSNKNFGKYGGCFTGVVTHIRLKYDRKGGLMGYFGLIDATGKWIEVICFASVWSEIAHRLKPFQLVRAQLDRKPDSYRGWSHFYNGGKLFIFKDKAKLAK